MKQNWSTGRPHDPPDAKMTDGGLESVSIVILSMLNKMGAVTKVKSHDKRARKDLIHRVVNRGEAGPMVKKPPPKKMIDVQILQGSRVYMSLEVEAGKTSTFKFYDGIHRRLAVSYVPNPNNLVMPYKTLLEAKAHLMRKYELLWMKYGRKYNALLAVYIVRNRLTFYANGGTLGRVPEGEEAAKKLFHR